MIDVAKLMTLKLIDIGVLENQVCQCHLNGLCQSLNVQGDTHLTKLYTSKPIVIRRSQLSLHSKEQTPAGTLLARSFHKTTCEELKAHGGAGEKEDLVKMTDPLVADFTQPQGLKSKCIWAKRLIFYR